MELVIRSQTIPAEQFWISERNPSIRLATVGRQDERQVHLWRACKKHLMYQSFKSVTDNFSKGHGTSMNCKACEQYNDMLKEGTQLPSIYESAAFRAIRALRLSDSDWIVDARVIVGQVGSVDIWILELNLLFMIDGETHFSDAYERLHQKQVEADDAFNDSATAQGFCVMRLHHKDVKHYKSLMSDMIAKCKSASRCTLLGALPIAETL